MKLFKYIGLAALGLTITMSTTSCKKDFLNPEPQSSLVGEGGAAINTLAKAEAILTGTYDALSDSDGMGLYGLIVPDVLGEDIVVNSSNNYNRFVDTYNYTLIPTSNDNYELWEKGYKVISNANYVLAAKDAVEIATPQDEAQRDRIMDEARTLRAFMHYQLVRLFGESYTSKPGGLGIPIVKAHSVTGEETPARNTVAEVYEFVRTELEAVLADGSLSASNNNGRLSEKAVHGILANLYMDMTSKKGAPNAEYLQKVLDHTDPALYAGSALATGTKYLEGMSAPNSETIWFIKYISSDYNYYMTLQSFYDNKRQGYSSMRLDRHFLETVIDTLSTDIRKDFVNRVSFANEDGSVGSRYDLSGNGYFLSKFPRMEGTVGLADVILLRYSEIILLRAEAYARQGDVNNAKMELDKIRTRAGVAASTAADADAALEEILLERRKELFGEGKRYFDLKRTEGTLQRNAPSNWSSIDHVSNYKFALPIPNAEIEANPNMVQNPTDLTTLHNN